MFLWGGERATPTQGREGDEVRECWETLLRGKGLCRIVVLETSVTPSHPLLAVSLDVM